MLRNAKIVRAAFPHVFVLSQCGLNFYVLMHDSNNSGLQTKGKKVRCQAIFFFHFLSIRAPVLAKTTL